MLIESGSRAAGIDPRDFDLPAGTALRYERPADALRPLLPSYAVLDSERALWDGIQSFLPPSWAQIWIVLAGDPITVRIGNRRYDPLGAAVLYGVTSRAMPVTSHGGVSIVVDVGPAGWARFVAAPANRLRDAITPLEQLLPAGRVHDLVACLHASDRGAGVKDILDAFFLEGLPPARSEEPLIARVMALLADPATRDLASAAAAVGIAPRRLARLTNRYFGFPPKLLLMRTRFMRALIAMLMAPEPADFAAVPPGYHDVPHFLRDAKRFLGMTPRRYLAVELRYFRAALRARTLVIGSPTPALDRASAPGGTAPR